MKFGVENSNRSGGLEIRDQETGQLLGGKRAAIQYFYTQRYGDTDEAEGGKQGDGQVVLKQAADTEYEMNIISN